MPFISPPICIFHEASSVQTGQCCYTGSCISFEPISYVRKSRTNCVFLTIHSAQRGVDCLARSIIDTVRWKYLLHSHAFGLFFWAIPMLSFCLLLLAFISDLSMHVLFLLLSLVQFPLKFIHVFDVSFLYYIHCSYIYNYIFTQTLYTPF